MNKTILQTTNKTNMLKALRQARANLIFAANQRIKMTQKEYILLIKLDEFLSTETL